MDNINIANQKIGENEIEDKVYELDYLINEGVNAKIPFEFTYPNTNKKVGVQVRPLTANEYQLCLVKSKKFKTNFLVEILKEGMFKMNGDKFPAEAIDKLASGVVVIIANEIARISGIEMVENIGVNQENLVEELLGF